MRRPSLFTTQREADDVVVYIIQIERQSGELSLVGGYAGEIVTERRSTFDFAPDRGLTRAFLAARDTPSDPRATSSFEAAVRQNLDGVWVKGQYFESRRRALALRRLPGAVIGGDERDFIGQYRRNSHRARDAKI